MKDLFKRAMRGLWNLTKMGAATGWRWFQGLSGKGKAITVAVLLVVFVVAGITSDQVEDTQQAADTSTTSESATTTESTQETTPESPPEETKPAQERFVSEETTDEGCPQDGNKVLVTPDCVAEEWPLTVDEGEAYCTEPSAALLRVPAGQPEGGIYGLNGMADSVVDGLKPLEDVWRENPDIDGTRINIGPLIDIALAMCDA